MCTTVLSACMCVRHVMNRIPQNRATLRMPGIKPGSSGKATSVVNQQANSPLAYDAVTPPQAASHHSSLWLRFAFSLLPELCILECSGDIIRLQDRSYPLLEASESFSASVGRSVKLSWILWHSPAALSAYLLVTPRSCVVFISRSMMFFLSGAGSRQTCYILSLMSLCPQSAHQITMLNLVPFLLLSNVGGVTNVYEVCSCLESQRSWDTL